MHVQVHAVNVGIDTDAPTHSNENIAAEQRDKIEASSGTQANNAQQIIPSDVVVKQSACDLTSDPPSHNTCSHAVSASSVGPGITSTYSAQHCSSSALSHPTDAAVLRLPPNSSASSPAALVHVDNPEIPAEYTHSAVGYNSRVLAGHVPTALYSAPSPEAAAALLSTSRNVTQDNSLHRGPSQSGFTNSCTSQALPVQREAGGVVSALDRTVATGTVQSSTVTVILRQSNTDTAQSGLSFEQPLERTPAAVTSVPTEQRLQSQIVAEDAAVTTKFVLYVPAAVVNVTKVGLKIFRGGVDFKVEMFQLSACPCVWESEQLTTKQSCAYSYCVKYKSSSGLMGFFMSAVGQNEHKAEDLTTRYTKKLLIHRDVFAPSYATKNKVDGYKYFLVEMIRVIECENDFVRAVREAVFYEDVIPNSSHELARYLTECATEVDSKPFRALFIISLLSDIIAHHRLQFSYINKNNAKLLLETLNNHVLGPHEFVYSSKDIDILAALTLIVEPTKAVLPSWPCVIYWCYPRLPGNEIIRRIYERKWVNGDNLANVSRALKTLIKHVGERSDAAELMVACLNRLDCLSTHLEVCESLKRKGIQDSYLQEMFKNVRLDLETSVEKQLATFKAVKDLKTMGSLVLKLLELFPHVMQKMALTTENKLVQMLSQNEDFTACHDELLVLVHCPLLFNGNASVESLMETLAKSRDNLLHQVFLELASDSKILPVLRAPKMIEFVELWMETAKTLKTGQNLADWYLYTSRVLYLPILISDSETKLKLNEMFITFFSQYTQQWAKQSAQAADLCVINALFGHLHGSNIELFDRVRQHLEDAISAVLRNANNFEEQHVTSLVTLLKSDQLFNVSSSACSVLERLVTVKSCSVHDAFLTVLSGEKFWSILTAADSRKLFERWIEAAINVHSKTKARQVDKKKATGRSHIVHLYEYLAKLYQLEVPTQHTDVKEYVDIKVKSVLDELDSVAAVDILDTMSGFDETAKELLQKHISERKSSALIPLRELQIRLAGIRQTNKKLDITDR
jgi:hypothetical protein